MQITIQKMWPLEAGRKSGGFKGTDGTNYYCEIPIYHMLSEGMTIDPPAERYVSKAGKTSYILDKKWSPNTVGAIIPQPNGFTGVTTHAAPPRQNGNSTQFRTPKEMFQSEVVVAALSTGKWDVFADLDDILRKAGEAWDMRG